MKEYICKDDLEIFDEWDISDSAWEEIQKIPTVTKADICREFVFQCKKRYEYVIRRNHNLDIGGYIDIDSIADDILAEMENENVR